MYYIYILYSTDSDIFYVGHSENPWIRIKQHNTDEKSTYSSKHRPWKLVSVFFVSTNRADALAMERFIKKQKSRKLIEKLINPEFILQNKLALLVRVPHLRD